MQNNDDTSLPRRQFVKLAGASAGVAMLPLAGCGGDSDSGSSASTTVDSAVADVEAAANDAVDAAKEMADDVAGEVAAAVDTVEEAASDAMDAAEDASSDAMDVAQDAVNDAADTVNEAVSGNSLPQLTEDDAQAVALGYQHDASTVSNDRYEAGQQCQNCVLYTGGDQAWGPCSIFPGKLVNANGWCSTYTAKPSA
ncbi:MAG: high-potential iron-sulfur protein [Pseudomonadota bacterium]